MSARLIVDADAVNNITYVLSKLRVYDVHLMPCNAPVKVSLTGPYMNWVVSTGAKGAGGAGIQRDHALHVGISCHIIIDGLPLF